MIRSRTALLVVVLACAAAAGAAEPGLRFGGLSVASPLGAPLDAALVVEGPSGAALEVALAPAAEYARRGLYRDPLLDGLRFEVAAQGDGRSTVRITSRDAVREPTLTLLVEARAARLRSQFEYTLLFDPPGAAHGLPAAAAPVIADGRPAGGDAAASAALPGEAPAAPAEVAGVEVVWEFDAYYTSVGINLPLTDEPVPEGGQLSEWEVYKKLFKDSLRPRVLLFEVSVYPMPVLGTYLKEHSPDTYDSFRVGDSDLNLLESLTAGFQEPWAVSMFVGSEMNFTKPGRERKGTNKGYMGYLVSYGAKHIKDNVLIDDDWWEFEWKLKGERDFEDEHLTWSFRTGIKNHGNPYIADIFYIGARRSNLDYRGRFLSFLQNSTIEVLTELTQDGFDFARQEIVIGKKYPFPDKGFALALDVGVIYQRSGKYLGPLADPNADEFAFVFRPNIEF
jgi:hypothetical protein